MQLRPLLIVGIVDMKLGDSKGFTLLELMIVVTIIGILAAIAYPSYTQYKQKVNRAEVKSEMLVLATDLQKYKAIKGGYLINNNPITLADLGRTASVNYPSQGQEFYTITLQGVTRNSWTLVATPNNQQSGTGVLELNHRGVKCWIKGALTCTPSATTSWDE